MDVKILIFDIACQSSNRYPAVYCGSFWNSSEKKPKQMKKSSKANPEISF